MPNRTSNESYNKRDQLHYDMLRIKAHKSIGLRKIIDDASKAANVSKNRFMLDAVINYAATFGIVPEQETTNE